jgi:hypothetical protein
MTTMQDLKLGLFLIEDRGLHFEERKIEKKIG